MRLVSLIAIAALALGALLAAEQCAAELLARSGRLPRAIAFERSPWLLGAVNARHLDLLAEPPGRVDLAALEEVLKADPRFSAARIRLGLEQERAGQFARAEQSLLAAARFDRQLAPAWALANFYFRRGRRGPFWHWARLAAARVYDDYRPLLQLADAYESHPAALLERLDAGAPLTRAYLDFLIGRRRLEDARQAARALLAYGEAADNARLATLIDRQIEARNAPAALELWNARFAPLDPARGLVLTNGELRDQPGGAGFDWRLPVCPGVAASWRAGEMRFDLAADAAACALFEQPLPVRPGARYRLRFSYRDSGPDEAGLYWSAGAAPEPAAAPLARQDAWGEASFAFTAGSGAILRLALWHRATPGRAASPAWVRLRHLRVEPF